MNDRITPEMAKKELARRELARRNSIKQNSAQQQKSLMDTLSNNPVTNFTLGAGDELRNLIASGINLAHDTLFEDKNVSPYGLESLITGQKKKKEFIPYAKSAEGTSYELGKLGGSIAGFLGGGEILGGTKAAQMIPGVARRAIGMGAYGALEKPEDRLKSSAEGAAISTALDLIPGIGKFAGKAANIIKPQKYSEEFLKKLGEGRSLEDNSKSIAKDIKSNYEKVKGEGSALYSPVFDTLGNSRIYREVGPKEENVYESMSGKFLKDYNIDLRDLHKDFISDPTLKKAHELQSQLGTEIRKLKKSDTKGHLSIADSNILKKYKRAQDAVKTDINKFLVSQDKKLASQYELATKNWVENVVPYIENPKIIGIAKGEITSPRNISNIFRNPESDILKIVEDLGPSINKKILYSELGKIKPNLTPERLLKEYEKLESKGLESYKSPEFTEELDKISGKISNRDTAQRLVGLLAGSSLGGAGGILPAIIGGAGGALISPIAIKKLQSKIPFKDQAELLKKYLKKPSRALSGKAGIELLDGAKDGVKNGEK